MNGFQGHMLSLSEDAKQSLTESEPKPRGQSVDSGTGGFC